MTLEDTAFLLTSCKQFLSLEGLGECLLALSIDYADIEQVHEKRAFLFVGALQPCQVHGNTQLQSHIDLVLGKSERQPWGRWFGERYSRMY